MALGDDRRVRCAVDIGGTFTDVVIVDDEGTYFIAKVPSTPADFSVGVLAGLERALSIAGWQPSSVELVLHATTVATNAILEGKGATTALITTKGFRDILEFRRLRVPHLYDILWSPSPPLVPRRRRFEIAERVDAKGTVIEALDVDGVAQIARTISEMGVRSVAICLINSYANPDHEQEIARRLRELLPDIALSVSTDIQRELKEYERTSTTVVNAYVKPTMQQYLHDLSARLRGIDAPILIMASSGSMMTAAKAAEHPAHIIESGPAAGVVGARGLCEAAQLADVIAFDMGGTTAKASLIEAGRVTTSPEHGVGGGLSSNANSLMGGSSGYVVRLPAIDLAEVGAGGGSIAWIDAGGGLQVGPRSAGAMPGPACYGHGGSEPTITDSNVVLGYLPEGTFGDGSLTIERSRAADALGERIARPLGLELEDAAYGIHVLANAAMTRAIKAVSTERGRDIRGHALVAFGGNGPMHAAGIARTLQIRRVLVPPGAGVFSAYGLLFSQIGQEDVQTVLLPLHEEHLGPLGAAVASSRARVLDDRAAQGYAEADVELELRLDMRYAGQAHFLTVNAPAADVEAGDLAELRARFGREHERTYGHANEDGAIEVLNVRMRGAAKQDAARDVRPGRGLSDDGIARGRTRKAYFGRDHGWLDLRCLTREEIASQGRTAGPLVVEERDCTILVPPGCTAEVDAASNVLIDIGEA